MIRALLVGKFWSNQISDCTYPFSLNCTIILGSPGSCYAGLEIEDERPDVLYLSTYALHMVCLVKTRFEIENTSLIKSK
jgi:hypothetical protein